MIKKENLLKILIGIVIFLIFGAIVVALVLDPKMGLIKKKEDNSIKMTNNNSEVENIEDINDIQKNNKINWRKMI